MTDLFKDKAKEWDSMPWPVQISKGVFAAMEAGLTLSEGQTVLDFGAGTGLVAGQLAPLVGRVLAVDISESMLAQLAQKPELKGKVETVCRDILEDPLEERVDVVASAMAMHHVEDTTALLRTLFAHLKPGGQIAIADLDTEEGDFHPPDIEGVFHAGFDRAALRALLEQVGFIDAGFVTAVEVQKNDKTYPIFLMTARKPG